MMENFFSEKSHAGRMAVIFAIVMTLPVVAMIVGGFTSNRPLYAGLGIGLWAIMLCFYVITAYLVMSHED